jgi:hypothetical protein
MLKLLCLNLNYVELKVCCNSSWRRDLFFVLLGKQNQVVYLVPPTDSANIL